MADIDDDGFNEDTFKGFGEDKPAEVTPPVVDKKDEPEKKEEPKPADEPKTDEPKKDAATEEAPTETPPAPTDDKKEEEKPKPEAPPETPSAPETPQPLTKDDVSAVIKDVLNNERMSGKELDGATQDVLEAYYPEGLTNVLKDEKSGKELRTPADVVEASGGEMTTEQAAQWLMNEQFTLDNAVAKIKEDARKIAETTVNFRRDAVSALEKYEPLFKAYPYLQQKTYDKLMKQVKVDEKRNVILSAPDVMEHYDDYLEPYRLAFEHSGAAATAPVTTPAADEPAKPSAEDRMDISGDGSSAASVADDPTDFAQQVKKELAKGF